MNEVSERRHAAAVAAGEQPATVILSGGKVLEVNTGRLEAVDVAIAGRRVAAVGDVSHTKGEATEVIDCIGLTLIPGLIDPHIHIRLCGVRAGWQHRQRRGAGEDRRRERTVACGTCHGADLKGLGPVPPLAGRSPSYTVRQMFDMQQGVRKGPWSALMKAAVEKLTIDDMIAIAAYTASREP